MVLFNELCKCGQSWQREQGTDQRCPNCDGTGRGRVPKAVLEIADAIKTGVDAGMAAIPMTTEEIARRVAEIRAMPDGYVARIASRKLRVDFLRHIHLAMTPELLRRDPGKFVPLEEQARLVLSAGE